MYKLGQQTLFERSEPFKMTTPLASVGIMSIGEMGLGIAKLLIAHDYRVVTNIAGRGYIYISLNFLFITIKTLG